MIKKAYKVVKGEKGYVPVYSDSHGGVLLGTIPNGKVVLRLMDKDVEYNYAQIDEKVVGDYAIKVSGKGQYWMEVPHMEEIVGDMAVTKKYRLINYDFGTKVIEVEEL